MRLRTQAAWLALLLAFATIGPALAETMPPKYQEVLRILGRSGDYKNNVLKVNLPRNDLHVVVDGVRTPTPFGFGGWIAMTAGTADHEVMMGDLVLLQQEVNPVMSALLDHGLEVTALHNHFFFEHPRVFYMHVHGHGAASELAARVKPALDLMGRAGASESGDTITGAALGGHLDTVRLSQIIGHGGEDNHGVYKITIGRPDIALNEMGAHINARMGLNTWAAFIGSDANAAVAGDIAMLESEVTPVLKALRSHGLQVVAIHQHMTGSRPVVIFLHYWGRGTAQQLAEGFKAALEQTGHDEKQP
jgi:hypothetical protein